MKLISILSTFTAQSPKNVFSLKFQKRKISRKKEKFFLHEKDVKAKAVNEFHAVRFETFCFFKNEGDVEKNMKNNSLKT